MKQCVFIEPWRGECPNETVEGGSCCLEHSKEKCTVCGEQATTRCQASIGLMCGAPLCSLCGHGEMCLRHASSGPLAIIRVLAGGEPSIPSIFGTEETKQADENRLNAIAARLKDGFQFNKDFDKAEAEGTLTEFLNNWRAAQKSV